ncbi:uncharacterized protein LOC129747977 [Uranotaenia lowii]|uniref:uncharacterized protein LOC129747977 n=1 Tax=Uranotaenia lowii TaxID=190385 RepID=UPI0024797CE0|nr:uncharacterized protein LOC129747977 [Uranotaenia lowii]
MKLLVLCVFVSAVAAEAPFTGYAPSGWRPQGAQFRLPTEYGAPASEGQKPEVEITKERVAIAAQIVEARTEYPVNEYLPPTTTEEAELDPIRVQGLPDNQFKDFRRGNLQKPVATNPGRRFNQSQQQQPQQQQQFRQQVQQQPDQQQPPTFFFANGQLRALPSANEYQQPQFGRLEQAQPVNSYGPPDQDTSSDEPATEQPEDVQPTTTVQPESDESSQEEEGQDNVNVNDGRTVLAVANSFSGQYYILGPDNTLQRVMYATSQTDEDLRDMGFTAQLRYTQVEPIRGPVYAYNEQGQLMRIFK